MNGPSDAAVEAAAEGLREYDSNIDAAWKYPDAARAALSAALPIIREELAAEIEAQRIVCPTHGIPDCSPLLNGCSLPNWMAGIKHRSADLVRGEGA